MQNVTRAEGLALLCAIIIFSGYGCSRSPMVNVPLEARKPPQRRLVKTQCFHIEIPLEWQVRSKHGNTMYVKNPHSGEIVILSIWAVSPNTAQEEIVCWLRNEAAQLTGNRGKPIQRKIGEHSAEGVKYLLPSEFLRRSKGLHKNMEQFIFTTRSGSTVIDITVLYGQKPTRDLEHFLRTVRIAY